MLELEIYTNKLLAELKKVSTPQKAKSSQRYFPHGIHCIGATASDIKLIITWFQSEHSTLTPDQMLTISEQLLTTTYYNEEVLLAFGLINKFVKKNYSDDLLLRFEYWLEHYTNNWSQVDDLCIKTIYQFLLARPHLIEATQHWAHSNVSWCRRASNVVWVKFIKRKIGKSIYMLDTQYIFDNCNLLLQDEDEFVQKSVGWLLKVTSAHHKLVVIEYIKNNAHLMTRPTLRYAIEKMDGDTRKALLLLP